MNMVDSPQALVGIHLFPLTLIHPHLNPLPSRERKRRDGRGCYRGGMRIKNRAGSGRAHRLANQPNGFTGLVPFRNSKYKMFLLVNPEDPVSPSTAPLATVSPSFTNNLEAWA